MDTIIEKISEIEAAATAIMEDANERKKAFAKEMEERTAAFDEGLEAETADNIKKLREKLDLDIKNKLKDQEDTAQNVMNAMNRQYDNHHTSYVQELFLNMTKG